MPQSDHISRAHFDDDTPLKFVPVSPVPQPPDREERERFARRRAAGDIADALAAAVGRSTAEAGTARLAARLAADADALRLERR
ncbi:MAG TPA: hypothetical protein VEB22_06315 [Phycisphaerales bacterium]|nr:hypothetical protein [Phycisphaerales bacterium]